MYPVPNPIGVLRVTLIGFINCLLEMHHRESVFFAEPFQHFGADGPDCRPVRVLERPRDGFTKHQLRMGERGNRVGQEFVVILLKFLDLVSIVDTDENADQIGMNVKRVLLPAGDQITGLVAADSAIEEGDLSFGMQRAVFRGDVVGIILAKFA